MKKINGTEFQVDAPPSKAHTLRTIIIGALAQGRTIIHNPLLAEDQINVIRSLKDMGVEIVIESDKILISGTSVLTR